MTVFAGTVEIGQGCNTIFSQVAAEELKVPMDKVRMHQLDTDVIPYDASTTSSRSTYHMGNAVRRASIHAREQIMEAASPMLEVGVQELDSATAKFSSKTSRSRRCPSARSSSASSASTAIVRGDASYTYEIGKDLDLETGHSDHASAFYMYATQAAEVWWMKRAAACACCACRRPTMSARRSIRSIASRKSKAASSWASVRRCTKR